MNLNAYKNNSFKVLLRNVIYKMEESGIIYEINYVKYYKLTSYCRKCNMDTSICISFSLVFGRKKKYLRFSDAFMHI